jgi:hypothetical protein
LDVVQLKGIEVGIGNMEKNLVYELKAPLKKTSDYLYAIEADTALSLGIGFKTGKFDLNMRGSNSGKDAPSGGETSGGGRRGSGGRSGEGMSTRPARGGEGAQQLKEIDFWLKVKLAK